MRGKLLVCLLGVGALTAVMLASTGAAQAAVAKYEWTNVAGYGAMWYNDTTTTNPLFYSSHSNDTPMSVDISEVGLYQSWVLPNGQCMAWYESGTKGTDVVDAHTCNGDNYTQWALEGPINGAYWLENEDANAKLCGADISALTSAKSGAAMTMVCLDLNTTGATSVDEWLPTKTS